MSVEEYNEKLNIIKKFNKYLETILEKSYDNDFEELDTLADFVKIYLNEHFDDDQNDQNDQNEQDDYYSNEENDQNDQNDNNDQNEEKDNQNEEKDNQNDTDSDDGFSNFTENLIKRSQIIGTDILSSAAEFINGTTQDLSKINLYNKFRDPIERMKKFLDNSVVQ
jgi:hypothetical protein